MDGSIYGAAKTGEPFDPINFIGKPQTLLRFLCWLFAIIIFGCISSQGWFYKDNEEHCLYNDNDNACNYGVTISVFAFLISIIFLVGDAIFSRFSNAKTRKRYVLADLTLSGLFIFLYFVGFCFLTNSWVKTEDGLPYQNAANNLRAVITFNFFSIFSWGSLALLAYLKFQQGLGQAFAPDYEPDPTNIRGANLAYPGGPDPISSYHESPFSPPKPQN